MDLPVIETHREAPQQYDFPRILDDNQLDLSPISIDTLQVNVGKLCNQACLHCHVDAGPKRTEIMDRRVADRVIHVLAEHDRITKLDITGGAPELCGEFERLVRAGRRLGKHVMVRHNLTVQFDPHPQSGTSMEHLPEFFADHGCEVICSMPYYTSYFTDKQRGRGAFDKSIEGLRRLNSVGYGIAGSGLELNLVYNPAGAFLPAAQESLEADFRRELRRNAGIEFTHLFTITNMPIHRFLHDLQRSGTYEQYMQRLLDAFNPVAARGVMCRTMISVDYDGRLSDCDFNQMLDLPVESGSPATIFDFDYDALVHRRIVFADHCFGCTAGAGSSCGGATV